MKKTALQLITALLIATISNGQGVSAKLKELAVPNSPAFIIADLTPSVFQSANTPKEFVLGLAQSFQESSDGFPQNYSAEFTPYWWINSKDRDVYSALGLRTTKDGEGRIQTVGKEDPFSGLKFTTVSLAFINKDLIPDSSRSNQRIVSLGIKTTILKIHKKDHASALRSEIQNWHTAAQAEFDSNNEIQNKLARYNGEDEAAYQQKLLDEFKTTQTVGIMKRITEEINEKPLFSWDIAAALATFGIGDSVWKTGRSGIWTTLTANIPLALDNERNKKNYFNLNFVFRYLTDKYQLVQKNKIAAGNNADIGGKLALDFEKLSIGVEALHRFANGKADAKNRTVGIINYKMGDNLYLRGAFGKNFDNPDKLVTIFGISWGFGTETIKLPD